MSLLPLVEGLRHNQWEHKSSLSVNLDRDIKTSIKTYLHRRSIDLDLAPRDGFIRTGTSIRTIKLLWTGWNRGETYLSSVDVNREIGTVSHQISIADVMLDET